MKPSFLIPFLVAGLFAADVRAKTLLNVRNFGAAGDGTNKDTVAFQKALDACAVSGGGEVLVPAGKYLIGSVQIGNGTILRLEKDSVVTGSPDPNDYPMLDIRWEGRWQPGRRALIYSANVDHTGIVGPGHIEGNPAVAAPQNPRGAVVLESISCNDVHWEGFTVTQGGNWATHPTYCSDVVIKHVNINGGRDGIDIDSCKNVRIEGCDIDTGDDSISLKSGRGLNGARLGKATEDVLISKCTLNGRRFAAIGIGSETSGGIRNVRIEHCKLTSRTFGVYVKTCIGRAGVIENISANDLDVLAGGFLRINLISSGNSNTADDPLEGLAGYPLGRNFRFSNIRVACTTLADASQISAGKPLEGLILKNITGTCTKGISLQNIKNTVLSGIKVTGYTGPLLATNDVRGTGLAGAVAYVPPPPAPARQRPSGEQISTTTNNPAAMPPTTSVSAVAFGTPTLEQISAASPFFTVDGKDPVLLTIPPGKLEDLQILRLWPAQAPLQQGDDPAIDIPTLTVFLPPTGKASRAAMIVMPGGAYSHLSPREGIPAARWLASNGITAFILKSRLGTKYHHPAELDDAQRAIRYVRANAPAWGLDPQRVGIIGFSAGGHLASTAATHFDAGDPASSDTVERVSSRPDLHILLYPVVTFTDEPNVHKGSRAWLLGKSPAPEIMELLSNEKQVTKDTPPAFIVHSTGDTTVPVANSDEYIAALMKNNVPFVYLREPIGKHGFGVTDDWSGQAMAWLHAQKF
jgi:polygalacturonase/acetyl esterase/lipase